MGWLDRISEIATKAQEALEGSAAEALDKVTGAASATAGGQAGPTAPPDSSSHGLDSLLTMDELRNLTGFDFVHQSPYHDDEWVGTSFAMGGGGPGHYHEIRRAKAAMPMPSGRTSSGR